MKAFIPEIDSKLRLNKDWTFDLHFECRNSHIYVADGYSETRNWREEKKPYKRTLPAGSEFVVSRIYVRNGAKDFSSVTLYVSKTTDEKLTATNLKRIPFSSSKLQHYGRFWVKLRDFNNAEFEVIENAVTVGKPALVKGEVMTMKQFRPSAQYPKYWVVFEHPDVELSFDGIVQTAQMRNVVIDPNKQESLPGHYTYKRTFEYITGQQFLYSPGFYVYRLVPEAWYRKNRDNPKFIRTTDNPFVKLVKLVKHPLEDKINIPREKKERILLGIENDQTELKDILVAGGKLTICKIKEVYK